MVRRGLALVVVLVGGCAEGDDPEQTTGQVLGGATDGQVSSTSDDPGMTSMNANTWTPATEGDADTTSTSDTGPANGDSSDEGGDTGPVDAYGPCQSQEGPIRLGERWPATAPGSAPNSGIDGFVTPAAAQEFECDPFAQDCPEGEKCMPWAADGGTTWNATRCSPIADNPTQVGEMCTVEGSGVSGIDDCDIGAMCFDVDGETNEGTCVEICSGSEANPVCTTPETSCTISNGGSLVLCQPICNPLAHECEDGEGCYLVEETTVCAPDASGDLGGPGDPCEFVNVCDDGLFCAGAAAVENCDGVGCCSPYCAVGDDSGCLEGQTCVPFFPNGAPSACLEALGGCSL